MAAHTVQVSFDGGSEAKNIVFKEEGKPVPPRGIVVARGDTVTWNGLGGNVTVEFTGPQPNADKAFESGTKMFRGGETAKISQNALTGPVNCTVTREQKK